MQADMLLVNGFYSFINCGPLTPYIGGGVGTARLKAKQVLAFAFFDGTTVDDHVTRFTYHLRGGLEYGLTQNLYYAYYDIVNPKFHDVLNNSFHLHHRLHTVNFGLKYSF